MAGASVGGLRWDIPPSVLAGKVGDYGERLLSAIYDLAQFFAGRIEAYAKANAPWTDRTGNARQGLTARAFRTATGVVLALFHQANYGVFLELKNAGRFAIIMKTLQTHYAPLMAAIRGVIGG